jgi:hypothetical protein
MKRPDVETLIAYAKGAVHPEKARVIERFLEQDSQTRRAIEQFRKMHAVPIAPGEALRSHRNSAPPSPPPGSMASHGAERQAHKGGSSKIVTILSATLTIVTALGLGGFLLERRDEESPIAVGRLSGIDTLSAALTRVETGGSDMAGDRAVTVVMTFRDAARRACREFELPSPARIAAHGGSKAVRGS